MRLWRCLRLGVAALLIAAFTCGFAVPARAAAAVPAPGAWLRPVGGRVVRPFEPPASRYGAGHLGVDFAAPPGTVVVAAGPGVVSFAGVVGGSVHVVVAHANGLRTSYSFLAAAFVHRGQAVSAGQPVGRSGGTGDNHDGSVVHFGLRVGDTYVDPLTLFETPDLSKIVHLSPHRDPVLDSVAQERSGLVAGLGRLVRGAVSKVTAGARAVGSGVAWLARVSAAQRGRIMKLALEGSVIALAVYLDSMSPRSAAIDVMSASKTMIAWARTLHSCDHHPLPANGKHGSGNRVMLVGGFDSKSDDANQFQPVGVPTAALGYATNDVRSFSYTDHGRAYAQTQTHEGIDKAVLQLRAQLQQMQREQPGRKVDLIAHSQGGVVALAFLLFSYSHNDPTLPPIDTLVTLSSPLKGDPIASLGNVLHHTVGGDVLLEMIKKRGRSIQDLAEHSGIIRAINGKSVPNALHLTTIGAADDYVVPAGFAHRGGASSVDVNPDGLNPHGAIKTDPHALRAIVAAINHRAMPCESFAEAFATATTATAISRLEHPSLALQAVNAVEGVGG